MAWDLEVGQSFSSFFFFFFFFFADQGHCGTDIAVESSYQVNNA